MRGNISWTLNQMKITNVLDMEQVSTPNEPYIVQSKLLFLWPIFVDFCYKLDMICRGQAYNQYAFFEQAHFGF